jgi:hypothetical protein
VRCKRDRSQICLVCEPDTVALNIPDIRCTRKLVQNEVGIDLSLVHFSKGDVAIPISSLINGDESSTIQLWMNMRDEENVSEYINAKGTRCFSNRLLTAQTFQYADEGSSSSEKLRWYSRILSLPV